jgi:chemotaxis protein MotA
LIIAIVIFCGSIYLAAGENYKIFFDPHALAIVIGGTLAAGLISFPLPEIIKAFRAVMLIFGKETFSFESYISQITSLAKQVREIKSYDSVDMTKIKDPFLRSGLQMLKDGIHTSEDIREILEARIHFNQARENAQSYIFGTLARLSPAFGLIATLIGLIDMLSKMSGGEMNKLGGSMAIALIATFYGVTLGNLIFTPLGEKLKRRTEEDVIFKTMIVEGIVLLNEFQHPFIVEDRLNSYVPAKKRQDSTSLDGITISLGSENKK